jgi:1-acyl-sn-glycerol-3-phosphate acyltransferase
MFDPKTNKFPYPEYTDQHYLNVKKDNGLVFDKNYPYIDKSFGFRFKKAMTRFLLLILVFPITKIRLGLKINGKKYLKQNRSLLRKGAVSVCNHVHMWDYLSIMRTIKPFKPYILAWDKNITGEMSGMIRSVGGIPIPTSTEGKFAFINEVGDMLNDGGWLHIYPEGSMWEYYEPIRPFKLGASYFAIKYNKPIVPFAFSYRKPNWLRRVIFKQIACFTLNVGEPLFKDETLPKEEQEKELLTRCHKEVCRLAGINEGENLYPPLFDHNKRIDYYTTQYGIGYKGSH